MHQRGLGPVRSSLCGGDIAVYLPGVFEDLFVKTQGAYDRKDVRKRVVVMLMPVFVRVSVSFSLMLALAVDRDVEFRRADAAGRLFR